MLNKYYSGTKINFIGFLMIFLQFQILNAQSGNNIVLWSSGIYHPVDIKNCGDNRLFIVSKSGLIYIADSAGNLLSEPFLDIDFRVKSTGNEQGLLGLAFHPAYPDSGYFFVNYTGMGDSSHISRFTVSPDNPNLADTLSEKKLLTIYQPYTNHNGGALDFGPDGYLYFGLGDGGSGGDPGNRAQDSLNFLGKILRIDIDQGDPYSIPEDNPFIDEPNGLNEIWALGLRNPWRFSFDRLTGDLWIADVGQNAWEEIDYQPASSLGGTNYGWRCYEGDEMYNSSGCNDPGFYTFPVYTYSHSEGCSVTGGYVYRGTMFPNFYGKYFFADYCSAEIWTIHSDGISWVTESFGDFSTNRFSAFGENANGELFVSGYVDGIIYRVVDSSSIITLNLKVFLEGSFEGTEMTTNLNIAGIIPLNQPFNSAPWNYNGTETVPDIPNSDIVDWVLIELRDAKSVSLATGSNRIARQAAFVNKDGNIVGLDGNPGIQFNNYVNHQLFVVVHHRNHLSVMSNQPLQEANNVYSWDFTTDQDQAFGGSDAQKELSPGIWGMITADGNRDGIIDNLDKSLIWENEAGEAGLLNSDYNLDGESNNNDKNDHWIPNLGNGSQVPN